MRKAISPGRWPTLAHSNLDPGALLRKPVSTGVENVADTCLSTHGRPYTLLGTIKIWNISKSMATNQSAWYSRLANESRTLALGIGSIGHFRVPPGLYFKERVGAQPLIWKCVFILMQIKLIFTRKVVHLASF